MENFKLMLKKAMAVLMIAVLLIGIAPIGSLADVDWSKFAFKANAAVTGQCGKNVYYTLDPDTKTLTISGTGDMYDYGDFYNEYGEEDFRAFLFRQSRIVENVIIKKGVTGIGNYMFLECFELEKITIPEGITRIGEGAFYHCASLKEVIIPEGVTSIGDSAFRICEDLKFVKFPRSVTSIGEDILDKTTAVYCYKNSNVASYVADNGLDKVVYVDGTDKESIIKGKIGKLSWTLDKRTGLLDITGTGKMISFANLSAPWSKYDYCITSLKVGKGTTNIGERAFSGCELLETVTLPNSITQIDADAFSGCVKLKAVTIPGSVKSIGRSAFDSCYGLESITIPESVTSIGEAVFHNCKGLKSIKIPKSISVIPDHAFAGCDSLKSVTIPNSVTEIGGYAFNNCDSLESITIPGSVETIGRGAFWYCVKLKNVTITNGVKYIGGECFADCQSLESITIPESVKSIYDEAFSDCENFTDIIVCGSDCKLSIGCGLNYTHRIHGLKGSKAESFAEEVGAEFFKMTPKTTKKPTVNSTGSVTYNCTCGKKHTETLPKLSAKNAKVSGLKAKKVKVAKAAEITLVWNNMGDGVKYEVYQKKGDQWKKIKTTTKTSYTVKKLKSDKSYKFKVRTIVNGKKGKYSSVLTVETIPETTSKLTLKAGKKQLTASWSKVSDISGYEISYSTSKKFSKKTTKVVKAKKSSKKTTIKKLTKNKKYYVRIRTYKTVNGKKVYSDWSKVKSVKVK